MSSVPALDVSDLSVEFGSSGWFGSQRPLRAVDEVSFKVMPRETVALVGESGSGKSTTARASMGLISRASGQVRVNGRDLPMKGRVPLEVRREVQAVFQDPFSSLDPRMRVLDVVAEPLDAHLKLTKNERRSRVAEAMQEVSLDPSMVTRYPRKFSGGQRQRIAIARAIVLRPTLLVWDEATASLDVSTQAQILNLLADLQSRLGLACLFISHDLSLVRRISQRTLVMYLSRIVEEGPTDRVWAAPAHPYTAGLLSAIPRFRLNRTPQERFLPKGDTPSAANPPAGCRFHTRCPLVMDICRTEDPPVYPVPGGGSSACHLHATGGLPESGSVLPLFHEKLHTGREQADSETSLTEIRRSTGRGARSRPQEADQAGGVRSEDPPAILV
jgi:peptide/nickel transport system ATP-binding protein